AGGEVHGKPPWWHWTSTHRRVSRPTVLVRSCRARVRGSDTHTPIHPHARTDLPCEGVACPASHFPSYLANNPLRAGERSHARLEEAAMELLTRTLDALEIGPPREHANLTMFPLLDGRAGEPDYQTLDEALAAGTAKVTEVSESGSVPELRFRNAGGCA